MATIHRAVDERFDRIVCVKLLRLDVDGGSSTDGRISASAVYRHFLREARALSKLQHPNTLRIYDFGYIEDGQRPFQISEFLDGGNLRQHVRSQGALRAEEMLAVLDCVTGAIAEAHDEKILHRDIKPSNILFSRVGGVLMPKLADFGIARTLRVRRAEEADLAASQSVGLFSPRWAAPEQLAGEAEGPQTDVYALALVAAYMLAGVSLIDGAQIPDIYDPDARADEVVQKRLVELGLPSGIVPVLCRALAADPSARTSGAVALFDELRTALGGIRAVLPPIPPESRRLLEPAAPSPAAPPPAARQAAVAPPAAPAPPQAVVGPARKVRITPVHEKLELDIPGDRGADVRFRVSIVPSRDRTSQIQIKGLNCFVSRFDATGSARPTPALSATQDGVVDFVSTTRQVLARTAFAFGRPTPDGRGQAFRLSGVDVVVSLEQGSFAVALDLGLDREIIVLCKRT